jgi:hypothetical protein
MTAQAREVGCPVRLPVMQQNNFGRHGICEGNDNATVSIALRAPLGDLSGKHSGANSIGSRALGK